MLKKKKIVQGPIDDTLNRDPMSFQNILDINIAMQKLFN